MLKKLKAKMKMPKITLPKLKVPESVKKAPSKVMGMFKKKKQNKMAVKKINGTDTLETFRTTFNDLALNDFGDAALLASAGISATSVVGAVVELSSQIGTGQGRRQI